MTDIVERLRAGWVSHKDAEEAADEIDRLRAAQTPGYNFLAGELVKRDAEIERLRAYSAHERSLGAEAPMIELMGARQEIEQLQARVEVFYPLAAENDRLQAEIARLNHLFQRDNVLNVLIDSRREVMLLREQLKQTIEPRKGEP